MFSSLSSARKVFACCFVSTPKKASSHPSRCSRSGPQKWPTSNTVETTSNTVETTSNVVDSASSSSLSWWGCFCCRRQTSTNETEARTGADEHNPHHDDKKERKEKEKRGVVYLVRAANYERVKVGYWTSSMKRLRARYATAYGFDLDLYWYPTPYPRLLEKTFMEAFDQHRVSGELFRANLLDVYRDYLRERAENRHEEIV